ncbi:MAG: hypothetical protein RR975_06670 [Clostridia bacterium]
MERDERMTAKEYLMQVRFIDRLIDSKLEQAAQLKATATKATATLSDMPRSDSPDLQSMETNIIKMIDLEREINRDVDRLVDLKKEAMCAISWCWSSAICASNRGGKSRRICATASVMSRACTVRHSRHF